MAKKSTKKKPAPKAGVHRRRGRSARRPAPKARPVQRGPRSQALPGMATVIPQALRNVCETLHEIREKKNALVLEEKAEIGRGMKLMRAAEREIVKWSGIELVFVKGDDKLRVRVIKDGGDGDDDGEQGDLGEAAREADGDQERAHEGAGGGDETE